MKFDSNTTTTLDYSTDTVLLGAIRDEDGSWIVTDRECDVWGHGRSLLEAMCDYWAALHSHLGALEDQSLTPRLERQVRVMRSRLEAKSGI